MPPKVMSVPKEWYQCMDAGTAAIRRPYQVRRFCQPGIPRVSIFHIPSFADCTGWTVYLLPRGGGYRLQTVVWHQPADGKRMEDLMQGRVTAAAAEPTLEEVCGALDPVWFERQLSLLGEIYVPLHTNRPIGLDGESFGVHCRSEFEVEWWCEGPPEWAALVAWTHECIGYFQRAAVA